MFTLVRVFTGSEKLLLPTTRSREKFLTVKNKTKTRPTLVGSQRRILYLTSYMFLNILSRSGTSQLPKFSQNSPSACALSHFKIGSTKFKKEIIERSSLGEGGAITIT